MGCAGREEYASLRLGAGLGGGVMGLAGLEVELQLWDGAEGAVGVVGGGLGGLLDTVAGNLAVCKGGRYVRCDCSAEVISHRRGSL